MTLQASADKCHINLKTSFRWRHRFLRYALTAGAKKLCGIVEADEIFIAESFKGFRHLKRKPRKHGGNGHGSVPLVPVLIALDSYENETETVLLDKSYQQALQAMQEAYPGHSLIIAYRLMASICQPVWRNKSALSPRVIGP